METFSEEFGRLTATYKRYNQRVQEITIEETKGELTPGLQMELGLYLQAMERIEEEANTVLARELERIIREEEELDPNECN